jgi:hypothetical protein
LLLSADPAAAGSLVVVDGSLGDQFSGSEVLVLDQNRDGLEQITQALAARSGSVSALNGRDSFLSRGPSQGSPQANFVEFLVNLARNLDSES